MTAPEGEGPLAGPDGAGTDEAIAETPNHVRRGSEIADEIPGLGRDIEGAISAIDDHGSALIESAGAIAKALDGIAEALVRLAEATRGSI